MAVLLGPLATALLFGQVQDPTTNVYAPLGVAGLICGVLTWVWLRAEKRAEAAEERERRLNEKIMDRVIPLLTEATRALGHSTNGLASRQQPSSEIGQAVDELRKTIAEMREQ